MKRGPSTLVRSGSGLLLLVAVVGFGVAAGSEGRSGAAAATATGSAEAQLRPIPASQAAGLPNRPVHPSPTVEPQLSPLPVSVPLRGEVGASAGGGMVGDDAAITRLEREFRERIGQYSWRNAHWGVAVVSLDVGDTLFAASGDSAMIPASNMKLLTSAAAMAALGGDFRYRTYLLTRGEVINGVLHGDLVLYGTGDPGIGDRFYPSRTTVFEQLAGELARQGIRSVMGDLVADPTYFPGPLRPESWDPRDLNDHFAPAVSALSFEENVVSLWVEAADQAGLPPKINTLPDNAGLEVVNLAVTTSRRPARRLTIRRDAPEDPIRIEGEIHLRGRDVWRQLTVSEPAWYALSVFRSVLTDEGITVAGRSRVARAPTESVLAGTRITVPSQEEAPRVRILARHVSAPLREYLAVVNKESNNLFAELAFRTVGRVVEGSGSEDASARGVARTLERLGVNVSSVAQADGSGLSPENRVRPLTFVELFARMQESPAWEDFWYTLPEAGNRRELRRMYNTAAAGNLRAKTGTIEGVSALSGVVRSAQGERLAFSFMVNGTPSTWLAKGVENELGERLAEFRRGRELDLSPPGATGSATR